jgi:integrase
MWTACTAERQARAPQEPQEARRRQANASDEQRAAPRALREHYVACGQLQGFVFACESGMPANYANARNPLSRALTAAGVEDDKETQRASFHAFRHGAASALIRAGADPVRVAKYLGDDVETVLSTYAHEWETARDDNLGESSLPP